MREFIEAQYDVQFISWAEPTEDGDALLFAGYLAGRLIVAESLALFISACQDLMLEPLRLAA